ncbi:hypothetical protein B9479_004373 [Cryptococcus floricola]|uniref:Chloride channel, nucleotide-sensitive, 1A n=1 Tax=Cryptococcus floricola TaxID=2591691 RepID=A0A5D3AXM3_9TREE|nr:hypothetical protein B9479_004373 [Cryptococcus floricola]
MLTQTSAPPQSISPEQHAQLTSSTPASFTDIPPVLRWEDDAEVELSSLSGGWEAWGSQGTKAGGRLYVTEESVAFIPSASATPGFNLPYVSLTLHALTPASANGPAHLYCQVDESDAPASDAIQVDAPVNGNGAVNGEAEDEDEDEGVEGEEEFTEMREVRIYLPDASKLESLFAALSQCSALHASLLPNGEPSNFFGFGADDSDDEGEDGQWDDADEEGQDETGRIDKRIKIATAEKVEDKKAGDEEGEVVDQMERFLNMVDWGNVEKPKGWDEAA